MLVSGSLERAMWAQGSHTPTNSFVVDFAQNLMRSCRLRLRNYGTAKTDNDKQHYPSDNSSVHALYKLPSPLQVPLFALLNEIQQGS